MIPINICRINHQNFLVEKFVCLSSFNISCNTFSNLQPLFVCATDSNLLFHSKMRTIAYFQSNKEMIFVSFVVITIYDSSVGSLRILFSSSCCLVLSMRFSLLLCSMTLPSCTTLMNHCVFTRELKTGHPPNWPYLRTILMFIFTLYTFTLWWKIDTFIRIALYFIKAYYLLTYLCGTESEIIFVVLCFESEIRSIIFKSDDDTN